jgi:hypothetical protein
MEGRICRVCSQVYNRPDARRKHEVRLTMYELYVRHTLTLHLRLCSGRSIVSRMRNLLNGIKNDGASRYGIDRLIILPDAASDLELV